RVAADLSRVARDLRRLAREDPLGPRAVRGGDRAPAVRARGPVEEPRHDREHRERLEQVAPVEQAAARRAPVRTARGLDRARVAHVLADALLDPLVAQPLDRDEVLLAIELDRRRLPPGLAAEVGQVARLRPPVRACLPVRGAAPTLEVAADEE